MSHVGRMCEGQYLHAREERTGSIVLCSEASSPHSRLSFFLVACPHELVEPGVWRTTCNNLCVGIHNVLQVACVYLAPDEPERVRTIVL